MTTRDNVGIFSLCERKVSQTSPSSILGRLHLFPFVNFFLRLIMFISFYGWNDCLYGFFHSWWKTTSTTPKTSSTNRSNKDNGGCTTFWKEHHTSKNKDKTKQEEEMNLRQIHSNVLESIIEQQLPSLLPIQIEAMEHHQCDVGIVVDISIPGDQEQRNNMNMNYSHDISLRSDLANRIVPIAQEQPFEMNETIINHINTNHTNSSSSTNITETTIPEAISLPPSMNTLEYMVYTNQWQMVWAIFLDATTSTSTTTAATLYPWMDPNHMEMMATLYLVDVLHHSSQIIPLSSSSVQSIQDCLIWLDPDFDIQKHLVRPLQYQRLMLETMNLPDDLQEMIWNEHVQAGVLQDVITTCARDVIKALDDDLSQVTLVNGH